MSKTQKPAALHYAAILDDFYMGLGRLDATGAAAELRRLHAANEALLKALEEAKVLIGAGNDSLSEAARQSNVNVAWHKLDAAASQAPAVRAEALTIERDEQMDRDYIPLPGGWELQTKGTGSTLRLLDRKTGDRFPLPLPDFVIHRIERMAYEIHAACTAPQTAGDERRHVICMCPDCVKPRSGWQLVTIGHAPGLDDLVHVTGSLEAHFPGIDPTPWMGHSPGVPKESDMPQKTYTKGRLYIAMTAAGDAAIMNTARPGPMCILRVIDTNFPEDEQLANAERLVTAWNSWESTPTDDIFSVAELFDERDHLLTVQADLVDLVDRLKGMADPYNRSDEDEATLAQAVDLLKRLRPGDKP